MTEIIIVGTYCPIRAVIPVKEDQKANRRRRGSAGGRPPVTKPFFGATARGAANYQGHAEIAALIEERLAPS